MGNEKAKIPMWFWVFGVISLLWNVLGLVAFYLQVEMDQASLMQMSENEYLLYKSTPSWINIVFALAVVSGILGCILLLQKRSLALFVLSVSLVSVLIQMGYVFLVQDTIELLGTSSLVMPSVVITWGVALVWLSQFGTKRAWLK